MKSFQLDLFSDNKEFTFYLISYKGDFWNGKEFTYGSKNAEHFKSEKEARKKRDLICKDLKIKRKNRDYLSIKKIIYSS
jgi:spermidine synthase